MAGKAENLGQSIRRLIAPNPSPMTERGTNTYFVGDGPVAVIDPGPEIDAHLDAILAQAPGTITHILVTHAHRDHSTLAPRLSAATGAPIYGFGPPRAGRSATMEALSDQIGGGEGLDEAFAPDHVLGQGDTLSVGPLTLTAHHTPGHFAGHLSFQLGSTVFTGDTVMGWSTSLISPPDGDAGAFRRSCQALAALNAARLLPGHGDAVDDPAARIAHLLTHRAGREAQILDALAEGHHALMDITTRVYGEIDKRLLPAASRNTLAHLIDLWEQNRIATEGKPRENSRWQAI